LHDNVVQEKAYAVPKQSVQRAPNAPDVEVGKRIGIILSGGNVDLENLPWSMQVTT
jgi:threonine dehydratase